jgi:transposase InsO family protein
MGFPPLSAEEMEEARRETAKFEAKTEALKLEIRHKKELIPLPPLLPRRVQAWFQMLLTPRNVAESIRSTQLELDWLTYDRTSRRRPLYPRKRALSLTNAPLMKYQWQRQSPFFSGLPAEIRRLVYVEVLGGLTIEIQVTQGGHNGPKGSEGLSIFWASRIDDSTGRYWCSPGYNGYFHGTEGGFRPCILPLLQTCRRV